MPYRGWLPSVDVRVELVGGHLVPTLQALLLTSGEQLPYDQLCICAGAAPRQLPPGALKPHIPPSLQGAAAEAESTLQLAELRSRVLTIRDTDSVARLGARWGCWS
jgi:hypothetical protein